MRTTSSFLACLARPVRTFFIPGKVFGLACTLTLLALCGAPTLARADVVTLATGSLAIAEAFAADGIGPHDAPISIYGGYSGVGDFSENLRAYQEAEGGFQFNPEPAAVAEANLAYTAHASSHEFSAAVNYSYYLDVNTAEALASAAIVFQYFAQFEITEAIGFQARTWFGTSGFNSFGSRFALDKAGAGGVRVFGGSDSGDNDQNLDLTGVLQPGLYYLSYQVGTSSSYDQLGSVVLSDRAESFLFTLDSGTNNSPAVPDAAPTLALLAFGLASLIATAKPAARSSRIEPVNHSSTLMGHLFRND